MKREKAENSTKPIDFRLWVSSVAFWQFAAFIMLILLIWVNGLLDLPSLIFGVKGSELDIFECSILTSGVIITAIVTVGHTYLKHRAVASSLITICSKCHKVKVNHEAWDAIEDYVSKHSDITFSHGLCPECFKESIKELGGSAEDSQIKA